ncbi:MAG: hypothetical protein ABR955_01370 [Verrucomicrobiota bacterium]|jgi:hypothetical protein
MANAEIELRRDEFFRNVWNHSEDPFQMKFDARRSLRTEELHFLEAVIDAIHSCSDDQELGVQLFEIVGGSPTSLALALQLSGLTRSKIITDLKAVGASKKPQVDFPSNYQALACSKSGWLLAGPYLAVRLRRVFGGLTKTELNKVAEALNQATWPGFIRQERAKRSGHEGEYRVATMLSECGIPFEPGEKADNPLCPDEQINGVSFDIVVPNVRAPHVCFKATVHTSNIGQFGESKDYLEVEEARRMLDTKFDDNHRPLLLALIDGIGFTSNRAGLDGVLSKADEFCQYATLWKAAVVCAARVGLQLQVELPDNEAKSHKAFLRRFNSLNKVSSTFNVNACQKRIRAGNADVIVPA